MLTKTTFTGFDVPADEMRMFVQNPFRLTTTQKETLISSMGFRNGVAPLVGAYGSLDRSKAKRIQRVRRIATYARGHRNFAELILKHEELQSWISDYAPTMWINTLSQEILDAGAQGPNTFLSKRLDAFIDLVQMMPLNGLCEDQMMPKRSAEIEESLRRGGMPELHERVIETNDVYNRIIPDEKYFEVS